MILGSSQKKLCLADWRYRKSRNSIDERIRHGLNAEFLEEESIITREAHKQLLEYMDGERKVFDIPLLMVGSDFQKSVWNELLNIPYGDTITYLELSNRLSNENAIRAIAGANGANAISILTPCHRIIGSGGKLIGYAGGLHTKKKLLQLEADKHNPVQMELFG